ncbi:MAG: ATP-binding cassette domain-containing protein [Candidatus Dadabacteria bacterium]|nr:ATP-binding cassette domain-containing protein [Candidatus Dadabacteria bacterium]
MDNAIVVEGLRKSYGKLSVLEGINFSVRRGSVFGLLGPNGAGKTTTIRILSTLLKPDGGRATVNGHDVVTDAHEVRSSIGLTGQYAAVDEYLTGEENLLMMGRLYRLSMADTKRRTAKLLKQFGLVDTAKRPLKTYSGGMRRRLDLAASLIASPSVIFLDEPTTGLDPRSRLVMWDIIKELAAGDTTILLTTQYMEEADRLAEYIVVIDKGTVISQGTPGELKARVGSERIELVIAEGSDFAAAQRAICAEGDHADPKKRTISVATKGGVTELKDVLDRLTRDGVEVETLSLHRPTLDDVFLTLTGHAASPADANGTSDGDSKRCEAPNAEDAKEKERIKS